jgi:hypothetical protein
LLINPPIQNTQDAMEKRGTPDVRTHCKNMEHGTRTQAAEKWWAEK